MTSTYVLSDNEREVIYDRQIRRKHNIPKNLRTIGGIYIVHHIGQFASEKCAHFHVDLTGLCPDGKHLLVPAFTPNGYTLDKLVHHQRVYHGMSEIESMVITDVKSVFWGWAHQGNLVSLGWFVASAQRHIVDPHTKCIGVMKNSGLAAVARSLLMRAAKRPHEFSTATTQHLRKILCGEINFYFP